MKINVINLIILDESGSMESIKKPSLDGLNETLQSIQSAQEKHKDLQKHYVTLVTFNSDQVKTLLNRVPTSAIRLLTNRDYQPSSCTPLFDAMGNSLSKLRHQLNKEEKNQVLVTIITDGYENASKEYTGKMIKHLVEELKAEGWVFAYIGANQDVDAVADSMSIQNRIAYEANFEGAEKLYKKENRSRLNFFDKISKKIYDNNIDLEKNFFEEES